VTAGSAPARLVRSRTAQPRATPRPSSSRPTVSVGARRPRWPPDAEITMLRGRPRRPRRRSDR
jgi:hypothetical protein